MKKADPRIVTPFDWQTYTGLHAQASIGKPRKPAASRAKPLTTRERIERILAQRWGNPYCKPGAA